MLNELGFYRKTYDDILTDLETMAKQQFGEDINVDETGPLGKFFRIFASSLDEVWQDVEGSYFTAFISTATGISLDRIATRVALSRMLEQNAIAVVKFTGTPGHTIPLGFIVGTENDIQFFTSENVLLDENGEGFTEVMCTEPGTQGNVLAGKINVIVNPDENVISVTNMEDAFDGRNKETDTAFRQRIMENIGNTAGSTINGIEGAIGKLDGVKSVAIVENATSELDELHRPPHSFEVYVQGGNDQEIAETIFDKKPIGIQTYGGISVDVVDIAGTTHEMKFSRPNVADIYLKVQVVVDSLFDDVQAIKTAIIDYIGGTDADGTFYYGLEMGKEVVHSKLLTCISNIEGVKDTQVQVSKNNNNFVSSNITINSYEIAQTDYEKITLEVML